MNVMPKQKYLSPLVSPRHVMKQQSYANPLNSRPQDYGERKYLAELMQVFLPPSLALSPHNVEQQGELILQWLVPQPCIYPKPGL